MFSSFPCLSLPVRQAGGRQVCKEGQREVEVFCLTPNAFLKEDFREGRNPLLLSIPSHFPLQRGRTGGGGPITERNF
jgi:hypothetical protein